MEQSTPKPVIGYTRVSTGRQEEEGVSLESQQQRIQSLAAANDSVVEAIYADAISGCRADNRPELQKALDHVCRIHGVLVVYSLSRLARSTRDTLAIADRLAKSDADLVSIVDKIDTTTASGKMIFRMLAVLAEFERDLISERTCGAMNYKRGRQERIGKIPFGYQLDPDGVHLIPKDDEQVTLDLIRAMMLNGMGYCAMAKHLNNLGAPTKQGGRWHPQVVLGIVKRLRKEQP